MDLLEYFTQYRATMSENQKMNLFNKLVNAVKYCHDNDIMHRDLKPDNVLVSADNQGNIQDLKLIDFGFACNISDKNNQNNKAIGSQGYMAPEIFSRKCQFDQAVDVWSLGVILYFMAVGEMPF